MKKNVLRNCNGKRAYTMKLYMHEEQNRSEKCFAFKREGQNQLEKWFALKRKGQNKSENLVFYIFFNY
ncbi:MAG: hypothetical protein LBK97_04865 [Prevotellaceae bacterium]|nr:hypothetical protein [Prevotellaceae bacterium]